MDIFKLHSRIVKAIKADAKSERLNTAKLDEYINNFSNDDFVFEGMEKKFQEIFRKNIHNKFIDLNNSEFPGHKVILREWFEGFKDRDNDIVYKLQKTFHGAFWEIYLFSFLKGNKFIVDFDKNSSPDFIINSPVEMCIEACVSNVQEINNKPVVTDSDRQLKRDNFSLKKPLWKEEQFKVNEILNEAIIRYCNAISKKHKLYENNYSKKDFVINRPYLLALTSYSQLNYGRENHYAALATFYGKYLNSTVSDCRYTDKEEVIKENGAKLDINLFNFKYSNGEYKYKYISAVVFSSKITLGKVSSLAEQLGVSYKKNSNYIFHVYEDLKSGKTNLNIITKYIKDDLINKDMVKYFSERYDEIDYNSENITNFSHEFYKNSVENWRIQT